MLEAIELAGARSDCPVFAGVNLRVTPGHALHLTGPNGSGKTTLLRTLAGLMRAETGQVRWRDCVIGPGSGHDDIAWLGHRNGLKDELTVIENLTFAIRLQHRDIAGRVRERSVMTALDEFGLAELAQVRVEALSQGQRRRAALARVLASDAALWLLDEPSNTLDAANVVRLERVCARHLAEGGMIVFANHQPLALPAAALRAYALTVPACVADCESGEEALWLAS